MNYKEIAFIICTNNLQYYEEAVRYINELEVPEGYNIDIIAVQEADSMTAGYNAGMQASDAKYKVYLHHDTFIINRRFIYDILNIFEKNMKIGMLGVIGSTKLSEDANCYLSWNVGKTRANNGCNSVEIVLYQKEEIVPVMAIDGMIMVTQYDVLWREDILDGWDFYDVSQSIEMYRNGYGVAVPYQSDYWCYHDCGPSSIKKYDYYRKVMVDEYSDIFTGQVKEENALEYKNEIEPVEKLADILIKSIEAGEVEKLVDMLPSIRTLSEQKEKEIRVIRTLLEMYLAEGNRKRHSSFFELTDWKEILGYYNWIRFILIRVGLGYKEERIYDLRKEIMNGNISYEAVRMLATTIFKDNPDNYLGVLTDKGYKENLEMDKMETCNICGNNVEFLPAPEHWRIEQKKYGFPYWNCVFESISRFKRTCPVCSSMDRERMIVMFLEMLKPEEGKKLKVLQIAPSYAMDNWLKAREYIDYETTDLYMDNVTFNSDIQDMYMVEDEKYDIILCSHILEHVEDDRKAMSELKRVLKKDGVCIFLVPLVIGLDKTDEAFGLSVEENWRRFGQDDHARLYSKEEFLKRLTEVGYLVHILDSDYFGIEGWKQVGLSGIHCLYAATKMDIGIGVEPYTIADATMEQPLVSVIIPTYNRGFCIERAVKSVLNQTYKNIEVIIIDDASADDTAKRIENLNDSRMRYIRLDKNMGANHARNVGIKVAEGEYIAFNDSDDEWLPEKLEKQMKIMLQANDENLGCVYCVVTKYENGNIVEIAPYIEAWAENLIGDIYEFMQGNMFISTQTLLIKKSVIEDVGYFNESLKRLQDWEFLLRIAQKYKFTLVQESLVTAHLQKDRISADSKGFINTVLYVIELHKIYQNNKAAYLNLIRTVIDFMSQGEFPKEYVQFVMDEIKRHNVLAQTDIAKLEIGLKQAEQPQKAEKVEIESNNIEVEKKINDLNEKIDNLTETVAQNNRMLNELMWAQVFNSAKIDFKWLGADVAFWPGRWGIGYQYLYVVGRILNEVQPKSILETGLGQSTRLIGSYVKWALKNAECEHLVLEHDRDWINIFKNGFKISEATQIIQRDLGAVQFSGQLGTNKFTYVYQNLDDVLTGKKFDFISIDAPYGTNEKDGYSRVDILKYMPECLNNSFCIVLDDYERWGEKNTVEQMKHILNRNGIAFCEAVYKGTQDMYMIVSPDLKYLCTL